MTRSGARALALLHSFEGIDYPWVWPGRASGVTIPFGYDLGYEAGFEHDWRGLLPEATMQVLRAVLGLKGERAREAARRIAHIHIPLDAAAKVFNQTVLPREEARTSQVFPGAETLPPDAFGALVSLVYNRGSLVDQTDRRREMLALYRLFRASHGPYDLRKVADLVEAQKRLWPDNVKSDGDLHDRRIAEAALIRACA